MVGAGSCCAVLLLRCCAAVLLAVLLLCCCCAAALSGCLHNSATLPASRPHTAPPTAPPRHLPPGRDLRSALDVVAAGTGGERLFSWYRRGRRVALDIAKAGVCAGWRLAAAGAGAERAHSPAVWAASAHAGGSACRRRPVLALVAPPGRAPCALPLSPASCRSPRPPSPWPCSQLPALEGRGAHGHQVKQRECGLLLCGWQASCGSPRCCTHTTTAHPHHRRPLRCAGPVDRQRHR